MKSYIFYTIFIFAGIYMYSQFPYKKIKKNKYIINSKPGKHFSYL